MLLLKEYRPALARHGSVRTGITDSCFLLMNVNISVRLRVLRGLFSSQDSAYACQLSLLPSLDLLQLPCFGICWSEFVQILTQDWVRLWSNLEVPNYQVLVGDISGLDHHVSCRFYFQKFQSICIHLISWASIDKSETLIYEMHSSHALDTRVLTLYRITITV